MKNNVYFVSGIDTDIGKSCVTGWLAHQWQQQGIKTITQKLIQTGNVELSEDIQKHREIMGCELLTEDKEGLTMPEIFSYPASPHLASRLDKRPINFAKIESAIATLSTRFDRVLLEGAGGLMVPLTESLLTIDYVAQQHFPVIFVTSGRLGSINHTLLSLEALAHRNLSVTHLIFNEWPVSTDNIIAADTKNFIADYLRKNWPQTAFICAPPLSL